MGGTKYEDYRRLLGAFLAGALTVEEFNHNIDTYLQDRPDWRLHDDFIKEIIEALRRRSEDELFYEEENEAATWRTEEVQFQPLDHRVLHDAQQQPQYLAKIAETLPNYDCLKSIAVSQLQTFMQPCSEMGFIYSSDGWSEITRSYCQASGLESPVDDSVGRLLWMVANHYTVTNRRTGCFE